MAVVAMFCFFAKQKEQTLTNFEFDPIYMKRRNKHGKRNYTKSK